MQPNMYYICVICSKTKPPLVVMTAEHREILDAIVPESGHALLQNTLLMTCLECNSLLEGASKCQKTAKVGIKHLLRLVPMLETKVDNPKNRKQIVSPLVKKQTEKEFLPKFFWDEKNSKYKSHCLVVRQSKLPTGLVVQVRADPRLVPKGKGKPEEITKVYTKPQMQLNEADEPKQNTQDVIIKDEPVFVIDSDSDTEPSEPVDETVLVNDIKCENEDFSIKPDVQSGTERYFSDYEVYTDIQPKPATEDCEPSLSPVSDVKDIPESERPEIKPDPDANESESTDTCESDYGNEEDIILAALAKTNVPTLPYLKGANAQVENNTSAATTTSRKRKRKRIGGRIVNTSKQSTNIRVDMPCVLCSRVFADKYDLREHIQRDHFENDLTCDIGKRKCNNANEFTKQKEEKKSPVKVNGKMPLSAAERQRRHREKRKLNPEIDAKVKRQDLERYHATKKLVKDMTPREHKKIKRQWQIRKRKIRERQKALRNGLMNALTSTPPPSSPRLLPSSPQCTRAQVTRRLRRRR